MIRNLFLFKMKNKYVKSIYKSSYLKWLKLTKEYLFKKNEKEDDILAGEALRINHLTRQHSIHNIHNVDFIIVGGPLQT